MTSYPRQGVLKSYSQIPIIIECNSKIKEDYIVWTRNYAISVGDIDPLPEESKPYEYSAVFNFTSKDK